MVVPMEQWAGQPFQDESADLWVVMLSDHNEKYSDRMERSYKAFAVTFELRFPFPLRTCKRFWNGPVDLVVSLSGSHVYKGNNDVWYRHIRGVVPGAGIKDRDK